MKKSQKGPHGVLVVDKPQGPTSHDIVQRVRKALKTRAVGHCGTLDPMATGVLVVAVGEATKLVPYLTSEDKAYAATIRLGVATDTLDAEGAVVETRDLPVLRDVAFYNQCEAVLAERARAAQIPPAYSAIRIDGERAHEIARRGDPVVLPARPVAVRSLAVTRAEGDSLDVVVEVAKGYFVRSLARDLAAGLGTLGHLTALRRTRSGAFTLADAVAAEGIVASQLLDLTAAAARALPVTRLTEEGVRAAGHGQPLRAEHMDTPHPIPRRGLAPTGCWWRSARSPKASWGESSAASPPCLMNPKKPKAFSPASSCLWRASSFIVRHLRERAVRRELQIGLVLLLRLGELSVLVEHQAVPVVRDRERRLFRRRLFQVGDRGARAVLRRKLAECTVRAKVRVVFDRRDRLVRTRQCTPGAARSVRNAKPMDPSNAPDHRPRRRAPV